MPVAVKLNDANRASAFLRDVFPTVTDTSHDQVISKMVGARHESIRLFEFIQHVQRTHINIFIYIYMYKVEYHLSRCRYVCYNFRRIGDDTGKARC